jgi:hypothetical protein
MDAVYAKKYFGEITKVEIFSFVIFKRCRVRDTGRKPGR